MVLLIWFFGMITLSFGRDLSLDVVDFNGNLQTVKIEAEEINNLDTAPTLEMPHVAFPNGNLALISAESDLDEVICEKLVGRYVFNPYRDLRISSYQVLSYRRGVFSGTYVVRGDKTSGYYEQLISDDGLIMRLGCYTY